jgi:hypothetical protein
MSKPYRLGVSPLPSLRRASPTYEQPNANAPTRGLCITPGFEMNQAPLGDEPLPNLPQQPVASSFRLR